MYGTFTRIAKLSRQEVPFSRQLFTSSALNGYIVGNGCCGGQMRVVVGLMVESLGVLDLYANRKVVASRGSLFASAFRVSFLRRRLFTADGRIKR